MRASAAKLHMPRLMEKGSDIWNKSSKPVTDRHQVKIFIVSVSGTICTPHQIHTRPCAKTFAVHGNARFYGQSLQKSPAVHEMGVFCGWDVKMSELRPRNSPFGGATLVQKAKRKMQVLKIKHLHFLCLQRDVAL